MIATQPMEIVITPNAFYFMLQEFSTLRRIYTDGRKHPAYTARGLEFAITRGVDPGGNKLQSAMPRYQMSKEDLADLVVYLNENRLGGSDQLRQVAVSDIREIRYFNSSEATTKWGTGHSAGAIQIVSR